MMQFPGGHPAMAAAYGGFQDPFAFQGGAFPQGQMGHLASSTVVPRHGDNSANSSFLVGKSSS